MPLTQQMLPALIKAASEEGSQAFKSGSDQQLARLHSYLKGQQQQQDIQQAQELQKSLGKDAKVGVGDVTMDPRAYQLTPAQEASEKAFGKQFSDYEAGGGSSALNLNAEKIKGVLSQLQTGKRSVFDRVAGALVPESLQGLVIPEEKGRRDTIRSTAISQAKQQDPNPTEKQINQIYGQLYDEGSSNESNQQKLNDYLQQTKAKSAQMESAAQQLRKTGFGTVGGVPRQPIVEAPTGVPMQSNNSNGDSLTRQARIRELRAKLGK